MPKDNKTAEAEAAYEERMARARLPLAHPKRVPYAVAARVAQRAYDRVMNGQPATPPNREIA